jgi:hypothetical protein
MLDISRKKCSHGTQNKSRNRSLLFRALKIIYIHAISTATQSSGNKFVFIIIHIFLLFSQNKRVYNWRSLFRESNTWFENILFLMLQASFHFLYIYCSQIEQYFIHILLKR